MYNVLGKLSSVMAPAPGLPTLEKTEAAKYVYLADGTKIGVSLPDGSETMYRGPFILHRNAAGDVELQTLILPEGIASIIISLFLKLQQQIDFHIYK